MSLLTTVIDDKSPLISYDATWLPGTSLNDNYAVNYYLGTFQKNSATDGMATFSFNASTFWIYGANRQNHGTYTIQVDSTNHPNFNGSSVNNTFQQSLFSTNVSQGMHTVNLINTGGASGLYVDIDMIVWQSEVGSPGDRLVPELVADVDPRFQYQQPAWGTSSSSYLDLNLFNNGTGHITDTYDATVSFTFTVCEAVTLFGTSGPSNGPYSVQMDGGQTGKYNATNAYPTNYGVAIYHADNLGSGSHQIVLTNLPDTNGQYLTIDYAQLWTIANTSTAVASCAPSSNSAISQNGLSSGAIAGLVVEGVVAVLAAAAAFFFYRRWKAELTAPQTFYTPFYRPPEATTETATGIAPSLETRSNPSSSRKNVSFANVGRSQQQTDNNPAVQNSIPSHAPSTSLDSRIVSEGTSSSGQFSNEGRAPRRRPLPDAQGGGPSQPAGVRNLAGLPTGQGRSAFEGTNEHPPPNYDTAMRRNM